MSHINDLVRYIKELEDTENQNKFSVPAQKKNLIESQITMPSYVQSIIEASISMYASAHRWHLITESYAEHEAFNGFYTDMQEAVDELSEKLISEYGRMIDKSTITLSYTPYNNALGILSSYNKMMESFLEVLEDESLKDAVIQINSLIQALKYKLENLK